MVMESMKMLVRKLPLIQGSTLQIVLKKGLYITFHESFLNNILNNKNKSTCCLIKLSELNRSGIVTHKAHEYAFHKKKKQRGENVTLMQESSCLKPSFFKRGSHLTCLLSSLKLPCKIES